MNNYCHKDGQLLRSGRVGKAESGGLEFCSSCGSKNAYSSAYCGTCGADTTRLKAPGAAPFTDAGKQMTEQAAARVLPKLGDVPIRRSAIIGLVGAAIAAVLMLVISYAAMTYMEGKVIDLAAQDGERVTAKMLRSGEFIEKEALDSDDIQLNVPRLYGITTAVALMNNVDVEVSANMAVDSYGYSDSESFRAGEKNGLFIATAAMVFVFVVMGAYIGWRSRSGNDPLTVPLAAGIVAYAIFVVICAWVANVDYVVGQVGVGNFWIDAHLTFGALSSIFQTVFIGLIAAGLTAFAVKYGKESGQIVRILPEWKRYGVTVAALFAAVSLAVTAFFFIYVQMNTSILIGEDKALGEGLLGNLLVTAMIPQMIHFAHASPVAMDFSTQVGTFLNGSLSIFSSKNDFLSIFSSSFGMEEHFTVLSKLKGALWYMPKVSILIPIVILVAAGYWLFDRLKANAKSILISAALYGGLLAIASLFDAFELTSVFAANVTVGTPLISAFFTPFLLALVCLSAGAFLKERRMA
ncbi:hypothetical protein [Sporosarcina sp. NCCP-2716]|uniref:hypothetical protein n=1 Tax=Sporosarcina sp. NCCP-2716 TaxID=2943679 RepID=UPI00203B4909|nr:hypothetical protein [Sporosarcina sp. NCCP-2716]